MRERNKTLLNIILYLYKTYADDQQNPRKILNHDERIGIT